MYAGSSNELNGVYSEFSVSIKLTKKGLEKYTEVAEAVFFYAWHLLTLAPQDYIFKEMKDLGKLGFEFSDKYDPVAYCVSLASLMQDYRDEPDSELENLLRLMHGPIEFDKERTGQLALMLSDPDKTNIFLSSKSFENDTFAYKEPYYKVPYDKEPFSNQLQTAVFSPQILLNGLELALPPPN